MILEEFMKGAVPSDRLIVEDSTGELYRGFVACLRYTQIDRSREVKRHGLSTDIHRKELKRVGAAGAGRDGTRNKCTGGRLRVIKSVFGSYLHNLSSSFPVLLLLPGIFCFCVSPCPILLVHIPP